MRYEPIEAAFFTSNRERLKRLLLPNSLVVVNANDVLPTNADGVLAMCPNSDLFYLTGVEQEESILLLYPDADDEKQREILFLREPTPELETWEGHKLTREEARKLTGIHRIEWLGAFPKLFHRLMCECAHVYLNSNEHKRAVIQNETREARFVADVLRHYPLHDYQRLAPPMHRLRVIKADVELKLLQRACQITEAGFRRVLQFVRPGVSEFEVEAEFAHEFTRRGGRFAYLPIIATGPNACALHYIANAAECTERDLLLLDVGACYGNYNADMTRTIPVSGRFTRRQRQVYDSVLRVLRKSIAGLVVGRKHKEWQKEGEHLVEKELVDLGLIRTREIRKQDEDEPAFKKFFMHGLGHPLGLDVHDVGLITEPIQAGWVMTVEPAIYIRAEGLAVRLETDVLVTDAGPVDLMSEVPIEADQIEDLMNRRSSSRPRTARASNGSGFKRETAVAFSSNGSRSI
jgi:Xaa-Pro aminopeptidase